MAKDETPMTAWQAGDMNESAHKHLLLFCVSWAIFMTVRGFELGFGIVKIAIIAGLGIYYWHERTNMGAEYLRSARKRS